VSRPDDQGVALVVVMMTISLLAALVGALTLAVITDTAIAANYRDGADVLYAAEAAVEFVLQEVAGVDDWSDLLDEGQSAFVDGPPAGIRDVGGVTVDLDRATADITLAATAAPGDVHLPSMLYAFGWFRDLVPGIAGSSVYVAVWLADRSTAPKDDAAPPGKLSIVGEAFGTRGARRAVEVIVEKADISAVRRLGWRELP
jgi:hypothetical protein